MQSICFDELKHSSLN